MIGGYVDLINGVCEDFKGDLGFVEGVVNSVEDVRKVVC